MKNKRKITLITVGISVCLIFAALLPYAIFSHVDSRLMSGKITGSERDKPQFVADDVLIVRNSKKHLSYAGEVFFTYDEYGDVYVNAVDFIRFFCDHSNSQVGRLFEKLLEAEPDQINRVLSRVRSLVSGFLTGMEGIRERAKYDREVLYDMLDRTVFNWIYDLPAASLGYGVGFRKGKLYESPEVVGVPFRFSYSLDDETGKLYSFEAEFLNIDSKIQLPTDAERIDMMREYCKYLEIDTMDDWVTVGSGKSLRLYSEKLDIYIKCHCVLTNKISSSLYIEIGLSNDRYEIPNGIG